MRTPDRAAAPGRAPAPNYGYLQHRVNVAYRRLGAAVFRRESGNDAFCVEYRGYVDALRELDERCAAARGARDSSGSLGCVWSLGNAEAMFGRLLVKQEGDNASFRTAYACELREVWAEEQAMRDAEDARGDRAAQRAWEREFFEQCRREGGERFGRAPTPTLACPACGAEAPVDQVRCPRCGASLAAERARYGKCPRCGAYAAYPDPDARYRVRHCAECGSNLVPLVPPSPRERIAFTGAEANAGAGASEQDGK